MKYAKQTNNEVEKHSAWYLRLISFGIVSRYHRQIHNAKKVSFRDRVPPYMWQEIMSGLKKEWSVYLIIVSHTKAPQSCFNRLVYHVGCRASSVSVQLGSFYITT